MSEGAAAAIDLGIDGLDDAVEIGRGGFATVYRARQRTLSRTVAVKVLHDAVTDERVRLRFERECWAMGTLASHPNIITVHGSGFTDRGQPYIVMEFTPNGALSNRLAASGPLPWTEVLSIGVKTAGALETAHRGGVLHRDVKPENVLVSAYGEPQLADFGIARLQGREETKTDTLTASIAHVSPELLAGQPPSALSDVYALGSTLFMLLAGAPAFIHDTDQSIVPALTRIISDPVPDLRERGVPEAVCAVVEQLMAKDTAARVSTAAAAGRALQDCQRRMDQRVCPLTIVGEPQRITAPADDGATNTIDPETLAALPGVGRGTARSLVAGAGRAAGVAPGSSGPATAPRQGAGPATAPRQEAPPAAAPRQEAPPAAAPGQTDAGGAVPAGPQRRGPRAPVLVGVAVVAVLGLLGGGWLLLPGDDDLATANAVTPAGVDGPALRTARLEPDDLAGSWTLDADLERQARAAVPAMLCTGTEYAAPAEVVAYRAGSPGPRVAQALRTFPAGEAEAFMAALGEEAPCLERLGGVEGVRAETLDLGDGGMRISYTRPGSALTLDVDLVFQRVGDVVSQVIHLDYPRTDEALTDDLVDTTNAKLTALSG